MAVRFVRAILTVTSNATHMACELANSNIKPLNLAARIIFAW